MLNCNPGEQIFKLVSELYPICRSITGEGVRKTLRIIKKHLPNLVTYEIPSGSQCFDWVIPDEWNISDAYLEDESGNRIIDFHENNLHVVNYSIPINKGLSFEELDKHLHSLPNNPHAIPYITSYYKPTWGFCMTHLERSKLSKGNYHAVINSSLKPGSLTYADLLIPGKSTKEILLSTYICHPYMANNETSGMALTTFLGKKLLAKQHHYTYRLIFVPETIGAIAYLSKNLKVMQERTVAGFQISCVGDDRDYSYLPSRTGKTYADRVARHVMDYKIKRYKKYTFLDRGSDERQYCSPLIDLPVVSLSRSKYGSYPEYHTSLDNLSLVTASGLQGGIDIYWDCLQIIENNHFYQITTYGEPQLGKRGLRETIGSTNHERTISKFNKTVTNFLAYCDGKTDLITLAETIGVYLIDLLPLISRLKEEKLICDMGRSFN